MSDVIIESARVPATLGQQRFDLIACRLFPHFSRARLQAWIKSGELTVNGFKKKPKDKLIQGDQLHLKGVLPVRDTFQAEAIDLRIIHEDNAIILLNKPAGLVVHPAAGHWQGTLLNGLLHYCPALATLPRAGIVHRLDKDTSGLMVVAKTLEAQQHLIDQLQTRTLNRQYQAVTQGIPTPADGKIDAPIGRHPSQRIKMAVVTGHHGKEAISEYRTLTAFNDHTHIKVKLMTGRTHQIRVHLSHLGYPLVGDPVYLNKTVIPKSASPMLKQQLQSFTRQALHAQSLGLIHPESGQPVEFSCELPEDIQQLLEALEHG